MYAKQRWKQPQLWVFLALFFLLWTPEFVLGYCNSDPRLEIPPDKTLECEYDTDKPRGPSPKYTGAATSHAAPECWFCEPCEPTYYDQVVPDSHKCRCDRVIKRTWKTSACDRETTKVQTITIQDTTAPRIWGEHQLVAECGCDYSPEALGYPSVADKCSDKINLTYCDQDYPGKCPVVKTVKRTWTATDECGNQGKFVQWITIKDKTDHVWISKPDNLTLSCKDCSDPSETGTPVANDSCSSVDVTYHDYRIPGCCNTTIHRVWKATDECGNYISFIQVITIVDNEEPCWIYKPDDITIKCNDDPTPDRCGTPKAKDDCSKVSITYNDTIIPGKCSCSKTIKRTWTATDKCGNKASFYQYIYVKDDEAPWFKDLKNHTIQCGQDDSCEALGGYPRVWDNCSPVDKCSIHYKEWVVKGYCPQGKEIHRLWKVCDECDNCREALQVITVRDNTPPCWDEHSLPRASITLECTDSTHPDHCGIPKAIDSCGRVHIRYNDTVCEGSCKGEKSIKREWKACDDCRNCVTYTQYIYVKDKTKPTWNDLPGNKTISCSEDTTPDHCGAPKARDNCCDVVHVDYCDYVLPGKCECSKTIKRTWTAKDSCGNINTYDQYIFVKDDEPPRFKNLRNITIDCDKDSSCEAVGYPQVWDNCSPPKKIRLTYKDWTDPGSCRHEKVIYRRWTAEDECGNVAKALQVIYIRDDTAPVWSLPLPPSEVTVGCGESTDPSNTGTPCATDNCDHDLHVTYKDYISPEDCCPYIKTIVRTWTVCDSCGNTNTYIQRIHVKLSPPNGIDFHDFCIWPPNHSYFTVKNLTHTSLVTARWYCPGYKNLYVIGATCSSNQHDNEERDIVEDGREQKGCYYSRSEDTLYVKAECSGDQDRIYTVTVHVVDSLDPHCRTLSKEVTGTITIPHDSEREHKECLPPHARN